MQLKDYDIVVHIGAPKTGSSALQHFLLKNRTALRDFGYYYPEHALDVNNVSGGHAMFSTPLGKNNLELAGAILSNLIREARSLNLVLLISAEGLYHYPERFKAITQDCKIKVISFFRNPLESLQSAYNQKVKRHYEARTLEAYCRSPELWSSHVGGDFILRWVNAFGRENVDVLAYDQMQFNQRRIEYAMLDLLEVKESSWPEFVYRDKPVNRSYTESAKELKRLLNMVLDQSVAQQHFNIKVDHMLQKFSDENLEAECTLKELLPENLYLAVLREVENGNQSLDTIRQMVKPPVRSNWLSFQEDGETYGDKPQRHYMYSLGYVANVAFANAPEITAYFKLCIEKYLKVSGFSLEIARLINALGYSPSDFDVPHNFSGAEQMKPMRGAADKKMYGIGWHKRVMSELPGSLTHLLAIVLLLEDAGRYAEAGEVVNRVIGLNGELEAARVIRNRLNKKIAMDRRIDISVGNGNNAKS